MSTAGGEPEARRYVLEHPRDAIRRVRAARERPVDARLGEAGRELLESLLANLGVELDRRRQRLEVLENQIARLVGFIADGLGSTAVSAKLQELEAEAEKEREAVADRKAPVTPKLPLARDVVARVRELRAVLRGDPIRAREALRRRFASGCLTVTPQGDGSYLASGELVPPLFHSSRHAKRSPRPRWA